MRILLLLAALLVPPLGWAAPQPQPLPRPAVPDDSDLPPPFDIELKSDKDKLPPYLGVFGPKELLDETGFVSAPGRWIEYAMITLDGDLDSNVTLRASETGPSREGKRWFELTVVSGGTKATMRFQTQGGGTGNLQRLIAKGPDMPPIELPADHVTISPAGLTASGGPQPESPIDGTLRHAGKETVKTPLGTFETDHWIYTVGQDFHYWVASDKSLPFSRIVKFTTIDGTAIATSQGSDAQPTVLTPAAPTR